jgi:hypothetical protein
MQLNEECKYGTEFIEAGLDEEQMKRHGYYFHCACLKVRKWEIFDRSDFHYFYTIKSLREGDFGVKIQICEKKKKHLGVHLGTGVFDIYI